MSEEGRSSINSANFVMDWVFLGEKGVGSQKKRKRKRARLRRESRGEKRDTPGVPIGLRDEQQKGIKEKKGKEENESISRKSQTGFDGGNALFKRV